MWILPAEISVRFVVCEDRSTDNTVEVINSLADDLRYSRGSSTARGRRPPRSSASLIDGPSVFRVPYGPEPVVVIGGTRLG